MKIFVPDGADKDSVIDKTKYEFDLIKDLDIPNVMKYYEFKENATWVKSDGSKKQVCYLLMELLDGVELLDFLNECQEQKDEFLRYIFLELAKTIHLLHRAGISHRDIKPENVMITTDYKIKVIDLGFGIPLAGRKGKGYMNTRLGTPMYMAPEIRSKDAPY